MNFKDQYKKDFENIKTDDKFKADLVKQLESAKKENSKGKIYAFSGVIAAAAILAVVIGIEKAPLPSLCAQCTLNSSSSI